MDKKNLEITLYQVNEIENNVKELQGELEKASIYKDMMDSGLNEMLELIHLIDEKKDSEQTMEKIRQKLLLILPALISTRNIQEKKRLKNSKMLEEIKKIISEVKK